MNIHWKDWCWSWSSNTLATDAKNWLTGKRLWCWERLKAKGGRGWQRMRWLDGIINSTGMNLTRFQETVEDRGALLFAAHWVTKNQTQLSHWTATTNPLMWVPLSLDYERGNRLKERGQKVTPTEGSRTYTSTSTSFSTTPAPGQSQVGEVKIRLL